MIQNASREDVQRIAHAVVDGAVEWYHKPAYEKGESLGHATVSIATDAAIAALTEGLGSVAALRKAEKALEAADHVKDAERAAAAAASSRKLLNPGIKITDDGLQHVLERHSFHGVPKYAGKSKFNPGEDIRALIEAGSQQPMVNQASGRRARTFRAGREIGLDRTTGKQTDVMTIITESDGTLVTAFPGEP